MLELSTTKNADTTTGMQIAISILTTCTLSIVNMRSSDTWKLLHACSPWHTQAGMRLSHYKGKTQALQGMLIRLS
jgi:hypothetical protein